MERIATILLAAAMMGGLAGCVSPKYVDPRDVIAGAPGSPTMYDLESSAQMLMQQMLSHPRFFANYNAAKAANGGKLPVAVIGGLENKTAERIQGRLDAVGDTVRAALFSSGLFDLKDDDAAGAIKSRIVRGADGGMEDGALVQALGTQSSPDFIVLGDFRHFSDVGGDHAVRI